MIRQRGQVPAAAHGTIDAALEDGDEKSKEEVMEIDDEATIPAGEASNCRPEPTTASIEIFCGGAECHDEERDSMTLQLSKL